MNVRAFILFVIIATFIWWGWRTVLTPLERADIKAWIKRHWWVPLVVFTLAGLVVLLQLNLSMKVL